MLLPPPPSELALRADDDEPTPSGTTLPDDRALLEMISHAAAAHAIAVAPPSTAALPATAAFQKIC
jgi:hypothetical protein